MTTNANTYVNSLGLFNPRIIRDLLGRDFKGILEDALHRDADGVVSYKLPFGPRMHIVNGPFLIRDLQRQNHILGRKGSLTEAVFAILGKYSVIALL